MAFLLPELPYPKDALEPYISSRTLDFHHGKHHNAYVTNLNKLIEGTELEKESLEDIIKYSFGNPEKTGIFNNAAQVWNHTFYWYCMKKHGGGAPPKKILQLLEKNFGGFDQFKNAFKTAASTQFGSGWAWLVKDNDKLDIMKTANAGTPIAQGIKPLLTIDVWEHAYYLDFQNRRPDYIDNFIQFLLNWDFVLKNLQE
ncbi:superoxide dismutase [bacterium]|nr:superoxide dismutase [candidate division CSSED10-310 bacterium]